VATLVRGAREKVNAMPNIAEMFTLARKYHQEGNLSQAESLYHQILRATPDHAEAHHLLGILAYQTGRFHLAVASIGRALALNPASEPYHSSLGLAFNAGGQIEEAYSHFQEALRLKPDSANAHRNLGKWLLSQGRAGEAVAHFREGLRVQPDYAAGHNSLAIALLDQGKPEDASLHCVEAIRLNPNYAEAHNNLGMVHKQLGRFDQAVACFERALQLRPNYGVAHWNRSTLLLSQGDYLRGWPEYEWRWTTHGFAARQFPRPLWDGTDLKGATILLYSEQGLGDTMHFIRYVPLVRHRGGKVILECQPALLPLLAKYPGVDRLVGRGSPLPPFDFQAPLLSLPGIFRTTVSTIPANVPYLHPEALLADRWRKQLSDGKSASPDAGRCFRIGIAWQGSPQNPLDRQRSISSSHFASLSEIEGIQLISLQKDPASVGGGPLAKETASSGRSGQRSLLNVLEFSQLDEASGPFMDSAALVENLDLVISADTALPHLAGALGVPVWIAISLAPDWRWLLQRGDSPWYPTVRLFRQMSYGNWKDVFQRMAGELKALLASRVG
jgi:tetratricopeptide (TPR) repeat protein